MIIVKKPFIYLKDVYKFKYRKGTKSYSFLDPERFMFFERRVDDFQLKDSEKKLTSKDAEYEEITVNDFFKKIEYKRDNEREVLQFKDYGWNLKYVKLGLKVIRDAIVCIPLKLAFPLIIQNDNFKFYIAPIIDEDKDEE